MRNAINNNPIAQAAIIGVLLLVAALFVLGGMGKKSSEETPPAVDPATGAVAPPAATPATGTAPSTGVPTTEAPSTGVPTTGVPVVTGPPLPPRVNAAYRDGETIVLLVTRGGGYDDRLLRGSVAHLRSLPGIAVFATRASGVARYARITQAVQLDRPVAQQFRAR